MVDEVEIRNVGGRNGIASEATLAALVSALTTGNNSRERLARLESVARERNTSGLNEERKQRGVLTKAIVGTTAAAGRLAAEFVAGGNRMGDFSEAIFGAQSSITGLVKAVDGLIDNYRELSSVGASFNNSMYDFVKSSAQTGMSLSEYSGFILENSTKLRALGGTVTEGTKRFGDISKMLRQNFGSQLTRVGMTMEEMNSVLLEYTEYSIGKMGRETRSNAQLAKSAGEYALELDKVAKLTGMNRKQLAEEMAQQQADQRVRVAMNSMSADQQDNFNRALAMAGNAAPELKDALVDMADGIPNTEIAQKLTATSDTFKNMAGDVENMTTEEFAKFLRSMGQDVDTFSTSLGKGGMEALASSDAAYSAIFGIGASLRTYSDLTDAQIAAMERESAATDRLSETLLNFELALNNLKTFILEKIIGSEAFKQLEVMGSELVTLFTELFGGTGAGTQAKEGFQSLTDALLGPDGLITGGIQVLRDEIKEFTDYLKNGGDPVAYLKEGLMNITSTVYEWFKDLFLGKEVMVGREDDRHLERQGGLFDRMASAFESFWEGDTMESLKDTIAGYFRDLINLMQDTFVNSPLASMLGIVDRENVAIRQADQALADRAAGRSVTKIDAENALTGILGKGVWNMSSMGWAGGSQDLVDPAIISELLKTVNEDDYWTTSGALQDALQQLGDKYEAGSASAEQQELFEKAVSAFTRAEAEMANRPPSTAYGPGYANGTVGFENFGSESVAALHGVEAVVPRNTLAGDFLAKQFSNDWNSPKSTPSSSPPPSQEALIKHVNQLNNTMALVLSEIRKSNEIEKKTLSSVKGLSGDLYRGI